MGGAVPAGRIRDGEMIVRVLLWNFGPPTPSTFFPYAYLGPPPSGNGESNAGVAPPLIRHEDSA